MAALSQHDAVGECHSWLWHQFIVPPWARSLTLSEFHYPHLWNGDNTDSPYCKALWDLRIDVRGIPLSKCYNSLNNEHIYDLEAPACQTLVSGQYQGGVFFHRTVFYPHSQPQFPLPFRKSGCTLALHDGPTFSEELRQNLWIQNAKLWLQITAQTSPKFRTDSIILSQAE